MDTPEDKKIKLGALEFTLRHPSSFAACRDVIIAGGASPQRAFGAALGLCCPELVKRIKAHPYETDYNVLAFGGRMIDGLVKSKVPQIDIDRAISIAYGMIANEFAPPTEAEVKAAEDFTEPPKGG